ncbi:MAG: ATP-grasp domain-containing protein, partial [Planctomycetes bacterium]|nr:ATP-grasp domain-containing protein [Planctomycetota bacterium]
APAIESYLKIDRIISAAEIGNVQAIHPGYGFLSENPHFAEVCRSCKIEFIGPSHEAMIRLSNKSAARKLAEEAGVRVVPGSEGLLETDEEALAVAHEIGFPVLIKAAAGGGGRGMRVARNDVTLVSSLKAARTEAQAAFKDSSIYIEKLIENPRHIEVQMLADNHGNVVHLWDRDCSLQRRHQKLVEESPASNLALSVREEICKAAVKLTKAANYVSAGTVEFLLDKNNDFYFIEANARIQVEHPVTEMVTGIDLIKEQIRIAYGEPLRFAQEDITHQGAAIECRINAEDPENGFRSCPGLISRFDVPGGFGVRMDTHVIPGYRVSPHYDSLLGKLIVHQPTRAEAVDCMKRALDELRVEGVKTTIPLLREILSHAAFLEGRIDTTFVERTW